ncbi:MAG: hypothetical protein HY867_03495 [Chloroflexi bacterium]|nr:hypothetical protein [Chloroflexota bacterium]
MSLVWLKFVIWIVFGISTLIGSILLIYLGPNLLYFIRVWFSEQTPTGRPPTRKPRNLWILFWISALLTILTSAIGSSLPDLLPASERTTPTSLEALVPSYTPVIPAETSTITLTYTPLPTATWTSSVSPSQTATRTKTLTPTLTPTITPLALEDYGGLVRNCIPDRYWDFATSENIQLANGCLQLQKWGFYADEQAIIIKQPSPKIQAGDLEVNLYFSLVDRFEPPFDIFFKVYIESFDGSESSTVSPLFSIGLCDPANWQSSFKLVSFSSQNNSIQRGILVDQQNVWFRNFAVLGIMETKSYSLEVQPFRATIYEDSQYASKNGEQLWSATVTPDERHAFCIQYRMPINGELVATISDLRIESR